MKHEPRLTDNPANTPPRSSRWLVWLFLLCGVTLAGIAARYFYGNATPPPQASKHDRQAGKNQFAVVAKAAWRGDLPVYLSGLGTVTGLRTVTVKPRVDGELIHVHFKEGAWVKEGVLLAEIDPRPFQVQLMQAEGQLLRDQALLDNAQIDWQRYKTLLAQDSIAAQQVATQAALVKQYQGVVATDKGVVANAKLQLDYANITAPISGRLGLRGVDQGNIVKASDPNGIVVITQTQPIAVVFTLPEDQITIVMKQRQTGKALAVEAFDRSGKIPLAQGELLAVDNQIDLNSGTVKLKAQFANDNMALFANQFVNIKMRVDTLRDAVIIPDAAIQTGNTGTFVYVVKADQTVTMRPVKLGAVYEGTVAVLEGLQADEWVVIEGADKLREAAKVKLIDHEANSGSVAR
jgi:multidrug efflux system membrane fusion protein